MAGEQITRVVRSGTSVFAVSAAALFLAVTMTPSATMAAEGDQPSADAQAAPQGRPAPQSPPMRDPGAGDAFADPPPASGDKGTSCPAYDDGPLGLIV